jgi:hypothetical protein
MLLLHQGLTPAAPCSQSLTDVLAGVSSFSAASSKRPSSTWLRYMAVRLQELLPSCSCTQLCEALGALVQLGAAPGQQWLEDVAAAAAAMEALPAQRVHIEQQLAALGGSRQSNLTAAAEAAGSKNGHVEAAAVLL